MTATVNATHDPTLESWVDSANQPETDFPIQNLPVGVFRRRGSDEAFRVGVAIGDQIFDVTRAVALGLFDGDAAVAAEACGQPSLNGLMALGPGPNSALRSRLSDILRARGPLGGDAALAEGALVPQDEAEMAMPAQIGDYTDFYCSIHHATNVGSLFRPDNPLLPNYKHIPIGYHGRSSSIVLDGTPVVRPSGQRKAPDESAPTFGPSRLLDYELELGFFVGTGNALGSPIPMAEAGAQIFGYCLVNDWSARDVQAWEYQPLGPFLGKSFNTTVSPWVVTTEALAPFRVAAPERPEGDPRPLPYLDDAQDQARGGLDLVLEVHLSTAAMRERGDAPVRLSRGNARDLYWTPAQMLAHHASNGCNLNPGDLIASGTVSGPTKDARGCLLELTWRGSEPITLPDGETRRFLEDGDEVILRGHCVREGATRIGFGSCRGIVASSSGA